MSDYCSFCKTSNSQSLYKTYDTDNNNYTIKHCNNCRAYFLSPYPTDEVLKKAYTVSYYGQENKKFIPFVDKVIDYFRSGRARYIKKFTKPDANILDIGCGNGSFLKYLSRLGNYNLFGTEFDENTAARINNEGFIKIHTGNINNDTFQKNYFDAITMFHVFEHLTEPVKTLDIISSIIKKEGILVISFPNIDSFQSKVFKGKWLHLDPPRHLFFFTPSDFKKLMKSYGFELIKEKYFSLEQNPFGAIQSLLNIFCKKREILFEALKGNNIYTKEYKGYKLMVQKIFFILSFPLFVLSDILASTLKKGATVEFTFKNKGKN